MHALGWGLGFATLLGYVFRASLLALSFLWISCLHTQIRSRVGAVFDPAPTRHRAPYIVHGPHSLKTSCPGVPSGGGVAFAGMNPSVSEGEVLVVHLRVYVPSDLGSFSIGVLPVSVDLSSETINGSIPGQGSLAAGCSVRMDGTLCGTGRSETALKFSAGKVLPLTVELDRRRIGSAQAGSSAKASWVTRFKADGAVEEVPLSFTEPAMVTLTMYQKGSWAEVRVMCAKKSLSSDNFFCRCAVVVILRTLWCGRELSKARRCPRIPN